MFTDYRKRKERNILTSWRHIVKILFDRGRKYGVFFSYELATFFISKDGDWEIGIKHISEMSQM